MAFRTQSAKVQFSFSSGGKFLCGCCFFYFLDLTAVFLQQSVYQWIVKPQTVMKTNEMFLPGRMAFIFNMVRFDICLVSSQHTLSAYIR